MNSASVQHGDADEESQDNADAPAFGIGWSCALRASGVSITRAAIIICTVAGAVYQYSAAKPKVAGRRRGSCGDPGRDGRGTVIALAAVALPGASAQIATASVRGQPYSANGA